jgi:hypothetical protein
MPPVASPRSYVIVLCAFSFSISSCGVRHTSDSALEELFYLHEREFRALLADVQADTKFETLTPGWVSYAGHLCKVDEQDFSEIEDLGLTKQRWISYRKQMKNLGLAGGVLKSKGRVEFRVDPGSFFNGDSYKGYEYRQKPPEHLRTSLDGYRMSDSDKDTFGGWLVYKKLKDNDNWYLYFFVNK